MATRPSGSTVPDPRDRNLSTRERMIVAGLEGLTHRGDEILSDGLHRKRLAAIAGQSRQTLYNHFSDHGDYLDALVEAILDPTSDLWPVRDITDYMDDVIDDAAQDPLGVIHELSRRDHRALLDDEHWRLVVTMWALLGQREDVRQGLRRTWRFYNRRTKVAFEHLLETWGAEVVPPWTTERAAHVFAALSEGLAVRADALDGEGAELLAVTIATLAHVIVMPVGSPADPLEPVIPIEAGASAAPATPDQVERALAHALEGYVEHGRAPSFESMALAAGCAASALRARIGSHDDLVQALWARVGIDLGRRRAHDGETPVLVALRTHLEELATAAGLSPALTADLLRTDDLVGGARSALVVIVEVVEDLLEEARRCDALRFRAPPRALAGAIVRATLVTSVHRVPGAPDERSTGAVVDLVWDLLVDGATVCAPAGDVATGEPPLGTT